MPDHSPLEGGWPVRLRPVAEPIPGQLVWGPKILTFDGPQELAAHIARCPHDVTRIQGSPIGWANVCLNCWTALQWGRV